MLDDPHAENVDVGELYNIYFRHPAIEAEIAYTIREFEVRNLLIFNS
jgi:hypothetical protein